MVRLIQIVIVFCIAFSCLADNPGFVTSIRRPIIDKVRDQYFESVFEALGTQMLPDFSDGDISVSNIRVDLANSDPQNLQVSFSKDLNAIVVSIELTKVNINVNWKYKKLLVSLSGSAVIDGTIDGISLAIPIGTAQIGYFKIPSIDVSNFNLNFDSNVFRVKLKCSGCLPPVESLLTTFMKGSLLNKVKAQISTQVPFQVKTMGNSLLKDNYPTSIALYETIEFTTALVDDIHVEDDHLEIKFDGTIYRRDMGYERPYPAPEMPTFNPEDPGEIMMFFSSYLTDTLSDTLNLNEYTYKSKVLGIGFTATLDPSKGKTNIGFEEGDFVLDVHPRITTNALKLGAEFGAKIKLKIKIKNGNKANLMTVVPSVHKIALKSLKVIIGGVPINFSLLTFLVNPFIKLALNWLVIPKIEIPQSDLLPLTVTNNLLDFHSGYSELGILFDFNN